MRDLDGMQIPAWLLCERADHLGARDTALLTSRLTYENAPFRKPGCCLVASLEPRPIGPITQVGDVAADYG